MKATEKIISKVIRGIVSGEEYGWPPDCWGTFYQPERPVQRNEAPETPEDQDHTPNK